MNITEMIIFGIVMLHLLIGFGYLMYKLRAKRKPGSLYHGGKKNGILSGTITALKI